MLRMLPVYIWMLWMPAVHIMDAKDAPRVHMDVMDAHCRHYGCYECNWSPREECGCSHWDQGFVVTRPTQPGRQADTAVDCWSHEAGYREDISALDWTFSFKDSA